MELWNMPADVTISLLSSATRLRRAAAATPAPPSPAAPAGAVPIRGLGDLQKFQQSARGGIVTEAAEGAAALAQLDRFMLRGGGGGPSKE